MKRVIKRYSNRKLYDTVTRRFTTLDDVARLVENGTRILVRDHETGEDRTDEVLAPLLARKVAGLPGGTELLTGLLRTPTHLVDGVVDGVTGALPGSLPGITRRSSSDDDRDAEIRELRAQVAQLTEAVTLLMTDKADRLEDELAGRP